jgi:phage tail-like protein
MAERDVFQPFRYVVDLYVAEPSETPPATGGTPPGELLCRGAFSEVSGLEATMSPRRITEGGRNWGEIQRAGSTTFGAVTLRRGLTSCADLWKWFDAVTRQADYGLRLIGRIVVHDAVISGTPRPLLTVWLVNVLPTRFKGPDLSATASQVAVEEVQLAHEGLFLEQAEA